jgi:hypothetical protein
MQMEARTVKEAPRVPVAPGKMRKILTLPEGLAQRVREFRFARKYDRESEAYIELIERGLEAVEREETAKQGKQS